MPEELVPLVKSLFTVFQWFIGLSLAFAAVSFGMVRAVETFADIQSKVRRCGIYFLRNAVYSLIVLTLNEGLANFFTPSPYINAPGIMHLGWSFLPVAAMLVWIAAIGFLLMNTMLASLSLLLALWAEPFNKYMLGDDI